MKRILFFVFLFVLLNITICQDPENDEGDEEKAEEQREETTREFEKDNSVYVLKESDFDEFIQSKDTVLVEFYAPWCGHCKQLAPEYEKAAEELKDNEPPVFLAKIDATVETKLAQKFDVSGYPTLIAFKKGVQMEYEGARSQEGIVEKMKEIASPNYEPPADATLELTKDNFDEIISKEELIAVMFYAPWCGHCKKLKPDWEKAAKELKTRSPPIPMAKVDATVEKDLATRFKVQGYPTLKVFRKGREYDFKSEARDKWGLVSYLEELQEPPSELIDSLAQLKKKMSSDSESFVFSVAFLRDAERTSSRMYFEAVESMRGEMPFMHTFSEEAANSYKVPLDSMVLFLVERFQTKHEPKQRVLKLEGETKEQDLREFIEKHRVPLIGEYNSQSKKSVYKDSYPLVVFFFTVDWSFEHRDATQAWRKKFADVAAKHEGFTFVVADDEQNSDLFNEFGFDESGEEINIGILAEGDRKYPMEEMEEYDADQIEEFLVKFKQGKLKPRIKSQAIPARQPGPVVVVVGKTFEKIVLDESKDVLIELYAPWCGHCKKLEPIYKELATKLKSQQDLVIAKMDATANDAPPNYPSSGFPTIYFAPANNKQKPISFSGDRTVDGLKKFISEHASVSFKDAKQEL